MTYLQRLTFFAGLFFASSASLTDGGGTGEADGGGGGSPVVSEPSGDEPADESIPSTDEPAVDEPELTEPIDGQKPTVTPEAQLKQALSKLREIDPKMADVVRKAHYEASDFKREFPGGITEARELKDIFETIGGQEGLSSLQQEAKDYAVELSRMAEGNPEAVEQLARDYPEGLVRLVPPALAKMQQINPKAYMSQVVAPSAARVLGMTAAALGGRTALHALDRLSELITDGKQKETLELADGLRKWAADVNALAESRPREEGESPEAQKLKQERADLERMKGEQTTQTIGKGMIETMNTLITQQLTPLMKGIKLTPEQRNGLMNESRTVLANALKADNGYQQRMMALLKQGDTEAIIRFLRGRIQGDKVTRAVRQAWGSRGFSAARKPATNGAAAAVQMGKKPESAEINWSADRNRERYMRGEATLKNGKIAKWNWDDV